MLRWLVDGAIAYLATQHEGLKEPASVFREITEYRGEEDVLNQFISECVQVTKDAGDRVSGSALYSSYTQWSRDYGCQHKSHSSFTGALRKRNQWTISRSNGTIHTGIQIRLTDI